MRDGKKESTKGQIHEKKGKEGKEDREKERKRESRKESNTYNNINKKHKYRNTDRKRGVHSEKRK